MFAVKVPDKSAKWSWKIAFRIDFPLGRFASMESRDTGSIWKTEKASGFKANFKQVAFISLCPTSSLISYLQNFLVNSSKFQVYWEQLSDNPAWFIKSADGRLWFSTRWTLFWAFSPTWGTKSSGDFSIRSQVSFKITRLRTGNDLESDKFALCWCRKEVMWILL